MRRHRGRRGATGGGRARRDPDLRCAQRQRPRWAVRLSAHADDLVAGRRPGRAGGRGAAHAASPLPSEDRHRHEPTRFPLRQPAAHAARATPEREPRSRRGLHALRHGRRSRVIALRRAAPALRPGARRSERAGRAAALPACGQQRRTRARPARLVRSRAAGPLALRDGAPAPHVDDRARPGHDARQPRDRRQGHAGGRGHRLWRPLCRHAPDDDRDRAGGLRRRARPAAGGPRRRAHPGPPGADRRIGLHGHAHGGRDRSGRVAR